MLCKNLRFIVDKGVQAPAYESDGAVGIDVRAVKILQMYVGEVKADEMALEEVKKRFARDGVIELKPNTRILFGTGLKAEIPDGVELQVRPRSGCSLKKGYMVMNSPGTIDWDYRGEIGIIIGTIGTLSVTVNANERIAQLVPKECYPNREIDIISKFSNSTNRGAAGFGSTGTS